VGRDGSLACHAVRALRFILCRALHDGGVLPIL